MKIIPALDIKNGKCVRLSQGKADQETIYSDHPQEMADHWDEEGAQLIHVVDWTEPSKVALKIQKL